VGEKNHCRVNLHRGKNQKALHPRDYVHNTVTNIPFFAWTKRVSMSYSSLKLDKENALKNLPFLQPVVEKCRS
jgi:hypothetical protein